MNHLKAAVNLLVADTQTRDNEVYLIFIKMSIDVMINKKSLWWRGLKMSDALITKRAIATGLKELVDEKPFNKISIRDITEKCGLNRQTFYYHFQDKYELVNWIYYQEGFAPLMEGVTFENWYLKVEDFLVLMKKEQSFYYSTISCDERGMTEYLFNITATLFKEAIEKLDESHTVQPEDETFISHFFAHGVCGTIISWVKSGMREDPKLVAMNLKYIAINCEKLAYHRYMSAASD